MTKKKGNKYLDIAIGIAVTSHSGVFDKGGRPYILHPLHLMKKLLFDTELAQIAVLHDVIEDTDLTIQDLIDLGFSKRVTDALDLLTHKLEDTYEVYIEKIATNFDAIRVKRKDLEHNSDITRLKGIRPRDIERIAKYHKAFLFLGKARSNFLDYS